MHTATTPWGRIRLASDQGKNNKPPAYSWRPAGSRPNEDTGFSLKSSPLLYSGIALGVLAGAAISTYLWRQRVRALNLLQTSPLERAEQLIMSCEVKLDSIEQAIDDIKTARPEPS